MEGPSRLKRIDGPETEGKINKNNKKIKEIRKLKTMTAIGLAIGKCMSEIDRKSVEPGRWVTDKIISRAIKNMEEHS